MKICQCKPEPVEVSGGIITIHKCGLSYEEISNQSTTTIQESNTASSESNSDL